MEWLYGDVSKESLKIEFIKLDNREFEELEIDVSDIGSREGLIEKILEIHLDRNKMYKIILTGNRNFEIDTRSLLQAASRDNVLKIKDKTKISYDIESLAKQNNLRGIFIRETIKMYQDGKCTEEELQRAIEIGLDAMGSGG